MKNSFFLKTAFIAFLLCTFSLSAFAQKKLKADQPKGVSDEDKKAILEIFEDVDPTEYQLVFNNGKKVYGKKRIGMNDLRKVSKQTNAASKGVKWTFIVGDRSRNEVFYIYTEGESKMASLLGKRKMEALEKIAAKYEDVGSTQR